MKIWAHRGASAYAPENTLEAFKLAAEMHSDGVELDVHLNANGEIVVLHDETIDRTSNGSGVVGNMGLQELKQLDFGVLFETFHDVKIPTLEEVYELLKETSLTVNVELKTNQNEYPGIEQKCIQLAERMGMTERVLYSSFNFESLKRVKQHNPALPVALLYSKDEDETVIEVAKQMGAQALHPYFGLLRDEQDVQQMHKAGLLVHPWTVDRKHDMQRMIKLGVDALITDVPDIGREVFSLCLPTVGNTTYETTV